MIWVRGAAMGAGLVFGREAKARMRGGKSLVYQGNFSDEASDGSI
jgi:hypothetical protein